MGPLGWQEMVIISILALLIFGPKKLPELGRTIGKAMTEFRRASNELKATFDREMTSIEQENQSLKEVTQGYQNDLYNYDSSYYDSGAYGSESYDSNQESSSTVSASATQGADTPATEAPEGTVATAVNQDSEPAAATEGREENSEPRHT